MNNKNLMLVFFNFTKHSFILPIEISEAEYHEIKSTPDYIKIVTSPELQIFHANYKVPILSWPLPAILIWSGSSLLEQWLPEWGTILLGLVAILALVKSISYGMSAYSLWEVIQKKRKFYTRIKGFADSAGSYSEFVERYKK